ncbi:MAG TPA: hypothetical protein VF710_13465 [Longimicrobium sp.]|jgi:hypothetical protein
MGISKGSLQSIAKVPPAAEADEKRAAALAAPGVFRYRSHGAKHA